MCNKIKRGAKVKQLRLDFSDYSAKEQEKDAMKSRFKQVYLMKIDGVWGHYTIIDGKDEIDFHECKDLTETYFELKGQFPQHQVRVIRNEGLENYLRDIRKVRAKKQIQPLPIKYETAGKEH